MQYKHTKSPFKYRGTRIAGFYSWTDNTLPPSFQSPNVKNLKNNHHVR